MSEEIKEILYYFEKYHFEDTMIDGKETKLLYDYITNLQNKLQQKENIIKEVREYCIEVIKEHENGDYNVSTTQLAIEEHKKNIQNVLEILDKEVN